MEIVKRRRNNSKKHFVLAISFFNESQKKPQRLRVNFHILHATFYQTKLLTLIRVGERGGGVSLNNSEFLIRPSL